ncbi:MAG: molybdenum cofactor guanylyltransferase [Anaerolineae bacterium]|jgi:molybdopterin-guanine dinucleotide biosynthesis protein A
MSPDALPVSAVMLAGGKSRRLGRDKSLLRLDGQPLLVRTVQTLLPLSDDLIVVTNDGARYRTLDLPVRLVPDEQRGVGALMGIYSGLRAARHASALFVACDMPFLNRALLRYIISHAGGYDAVVPRVGDLFEPLHALYAKSCLPAIEDLLAAGGRRIFDFYPHVRVRYVDRKEIDRFDPDHLSFLNVNTPEDWLRVQVLFEERA